MTTLTHEDLAPPGASRRGPRPGPEATARGPRVIPLRDLWERTSLPLVRSVVLCVVLALAAAGAAVAVVLTRPGTYESRATLLMDEPGAVAASADAGVVQKLAALRPKYAALALTTPVLGSAARSTGLPLSVVGRDAGVTVPQNNLTMQTQGTASDARTAQRVAQALATSLSAFAASEQAATGVAPRERIVISVIDPAGPAVKTSPSTRRVVITALVAGLIVLILSYVVAQLVWTRPRRL